MVSGFGLAPGSAGFDHSVSVVQPPSPGIVAAPSTATSATQLPGSARRNSAGVPAGHESAAHIPSADNDALAAGGASHSADPLDFPDDL